VLITYFLGTDFVPGIYLCNTKSKNFDIYIDCYKEYICENGDYLNIKGEINWKGLLIFLKKVSKNYPNMF